MGGHDPDKPRATLSPRNWKAGADPCDLQFQLELVGVRSAASSRIMRRDVLDVVLVRRGAAVSAVCSTSHGEVVGALAAFRGLAQLINCLDAGVQFQAEVIEASATRCEVRVRRTE